MTETTAKKGMVKYKKGYSKNDFDYDYLQNINYDDKRTMKQVVETLFNENKSLKEKLVEMELKHQEEINALDSKYIAKFEAYDKTFEQNIKDFITRGF